MYMVSTHSLSSDDNSFLVCLYSDGDCPPVRAVGCIFLLLYRVIFGCEATHACVIFYQV